MRAAAPLLAACLLALAPAPPLPAAGWGDFYRSTRPAPAPATPRRGASGPAESLCVAEILAAQDRYGIPDNILLGLGLQEAGTTRNGALTVWPYSVNSEGQGRIFQTKEAALRFVTAERARGARSIDVGCMQVNLRWHPEAFPSVEAGFDPARNVDYAARFLVRLYQETGHWHQALGNYHSRTPDKHDSYTRAALRNIGVANERIAAFRALARGHVPGRTPPPEARPAPEVTRGAALWSTGGEAGEARHTPYGVYRLAPILPTLTRGD